MNVEYFVRRDGDSITLILLRPDSEPYPIEMSLGVAEFLHRELDTPSVEVYHTSLGGLRLTNESSEILIHSWDPPVVIRVTSQEAEILAEKLREYLDAPA